MIYVLAAAIHCKAQIIVTYNLRDFPKESLQQFEIEPQHPDLFLRHIIGLDISKFLAAVKEIRSRLCAPPVSVETYLDRLLNQHGLTLTVAFLKRFSSLI